MRGARKNAQGGPTQPPPHGASAGTPVRRRSRKRRRTVIGVVFGLIVLWAAASAVDSLLAARHVRQGAAQIDAARATLSADGLLSGAPSSPLRAAEASFASAHSLLSSPLLWPVDVLPSWGASSARSRTSRGQPARWREPG